jgi:hypothetical protein
MVASVRPTGNRISSRSSDKVEIRAVRQRTSRGSRIPNLLSSSPTSMSGNDPSLNYSGAAANHGHHPHQRVLHKDRAIDLHFTATQADLDAVTKSRRL